MTEILALLQTIAPLVEKTTLRQISQVIFGILVASGRITMLGLSRWIEKGGSYRTIQRFYDTILLCAFMVRQANLHLISKMRSDAALYPAFEGEHNGPGSKPKYGAKIDVCRMDENT
jgi:hypothetical protein